MLEPGAAVEASNPAPPASSLVELIQRNAVERASAVAIRCGDSILRYRELAEQSDCLAHRLRELGVVSSVLVGLLVERSPTMVVALLAILKAGAAYVPLDPSYPAPRLQAMLDDAQVALLISDTAILFSLDLNLPAQVLLLDEATAQPSHLPAPALPTAHPDDTAYVIFTSGSTGKPKGVEISHGALLNLLWSLKDKPGITSADTMLAVTSIAFDIAAAELFLPLLAGASIDLASRDEAASPARLLQKLDSGAITILQATPVTWRLLILAGWMGTAPLTVWCGGEEMTESLARDLLARAPAVWNLYGPTETTIWSTLMRLDRPAQRIPLGSPIANTSLYVLDEQQRQLADDIPGELCIGGSGLAKGYWRRPDLTRQSFPTVRLADGSTQRLYRTGDRVCRTRAGHLEFLGRLDRQVKLRGFRIELAEIEHIARQCPGVQQAALAKIEAQPEDPRRHDILAAFAVPEPRSALAAADLRLHLAQRLPTAMVPSCIRVVAALPTTLNGKLDRRQLATLTETHAPVLDAFDEPHPGLETRLAVLWSQALSLSSIGRDDNFFALGGDSLLAAHLETEMAAGIGPRSTVGSLLRAPTIAAYAGYLEGAGLPTSVLLHPGLQNSRLLDDTIFWMDNPDRLPCLAALLGDRRFYSMLLRPQDIAEQAPHYPLEALARRMVEHILALQPIGRFVIGGFCQNALLAYEVARQLHAGAHPVPLLIMIDPIEIDPGRRTGSPDSTGVFTGLRTRVTREWFHLRALARLAPSAWPAYLRQRYDGMRFEIEGKRWQRAARRGSIAPSPAPQLAQALFASRISYAPQPYPGPVLFIEPTVRPRAGDKANVEGWRSLAPHGSWRPVLGDHLGLFAPPAVEALADVVCRTLGENASLCIHDA